MGSSSESTKLYEALFLLNQKAAAGDFDECVQFVRETLSRAEAEVLALRKWDERKLAYEIEGQKRGTYLLAYFKSPGVQIANIERDCNLSEQVLRVMIIRADHIGPTEIELAQRDAEATLTLSGVRTRGGRRNPRRPVPSRTRHR